MELALSATLSRSLSRSLSGEQQQQHCPMSSTLSAKKKASKSCNLPDATILTRRQVRVSGEAEATHPEHAVLGEEVAPGGDQPGWSGAEID